MLRDGFVDLKRWPSNESQHEDVVFARMLFHANIDVANDALDRHWNGRPLRSEVEIAGREYDRQDDQT